MPHSANLRDMSQGNPLKLILTFSIPLFIGNVFQQLYAMVDTMVVGHFLGDTAIAAIGATASLYSLLLNFCNGLNIGYGIIVSQKFGAGNSRQMKQSIAGMVLLDMGITLVLTALSLIFLGPLMRFLNTPAEIFQQAYLYMFLICGGLVATMGYNMFATMLHSLGNSRVPLYFLMLSSLLNVGLDLLLVAVIPLGVAGAAIATVIAQAVSALLCGGYILRCYRDILPKKTDFRVPKDVRSQLLSTGFAMGMMSCLVDCGSVIFSRATNLLGQTAITAYTAGRRIMRIGISFLGNIAHAGSVFVGQNWGAQRFDRIRFGIRTLLGLEVGFSLLLTAVVYLFGRNLVIFTTGTRDPEVIRLAVLSLRIHFAATIPLGILFTLRQCLQSMGYKTVPLISSVIELLVKIFAALVLIPRLGFLGSCLTEPVSWCLMAAYLLFQYVSRRRTLFPDLRRFPSQANFCA